MPKRTNTLKREKEGLLCGKIVQSNLNPLFLFAAPVFGAVRAVRGNVF